MHKLLSVGTQMQWKRMNLPGNAGGGRRKWREGGADGMEGKEEEEGGEGGGLVQERKRQEGRTQEGVRGEEGGRQGERGGMEGRQRWERERREEGERGEEGGSPWKGTELSVSRTLGPCPRWCDGAALWRSPPLSWWESCRNICQSVGVKETTMYVRLSSPCLSVYPYVCPSVRLSVCLPVCLCLYVCLSVCVCLLQCIIKTTTFSGGKDISILRTSS